MHVQDWQDLYTAADIEYMFENFVDELNFGEIKVLDNLVQTSPVSSGVSIG